LILKERIMSSVSDIMSTDVQVVGPQETLRGAAQLMRDLDVGALPVCDGRRLLGMLTDRDITVRAVAIGLDASKVCVSDVMTDDLEFCTIEQDVHDLMRMMGEKQVRRLPVVDAERNLVGIVSLGDLATRQSANTDQTLREISEPA
jgi:CBS domain-containing protein